MKYLKFVIAVPVIIFLTLLNFNNDRAFEEIVTFIAILIGFSISALTIVANSKFANYLYARPDKEDTTRTSLHKLMDKFKLSTIIFVVTVVLIFFYSFIGNNIRWAGTLFGAKVSLGAFIRALVWYFTGLSLVEFIQLLNLIIQFIIKSASNDTTL